MKQKIYAGSQKKRASSYEMATNLGLCLLYNHFSLDYLLLLLLLLLLVSLFHLLMDLLYLVYYFYIWLFSPFDVSSVFQT